MGLELEGSNDAEVSAASPQSPEEVLVFRSARTQNTSICSHNLARKQIVDRHAVFPKQPSDAAAQRETADTCFGYYATGDGEAQYVRFTVKISQSGPTL